MVVESAMDRILGEVHQRVVHPTHDGLIPFQHKGLGPSFQFSTGRPRINAPTFSGRSS
jgi:hypothetical protein